MKVRAVLIAALMLSAAWLALADPAKPPRVILPVHPQGEVCAEYVSLAFPRDVQRSCVDAAEVARWVLLNARPESCH